jgi:Bacterial PH domain
VDSAPSPATVAFVPDHRYTLLAALGTAIALLAAVLSDDPAGHVLFSVAAVVLLGYVATDLIFRPRLTASPAGIVVNTPFARARLSWDEVADVRADTRFRRGLRTVTLEIDAGAVLAVFTRRTLGVEPAEAAARIAAVRPHSAG